MINWTLKTLPISKIKDYHKNPRKLTKEQEKQLKISLEKYGIIDKPIVNVDGTLIGGHQRKKVLKKIGHKEIECYIPDRELSTKEIEELNIRLNKNTGEWDLDILTNQWDRNELLEWGSLESEIPFAIDNEPLEDDSEILEPGKDEDAITKLGDIYDLDQHRIICGDSTNGDTVVLLLEQREPILMVTDPPYGVNHDPSWRDKYCIGKRGFSDKHANSKGLVKNDDKVDWSIAYSLFSGSVAYIWHAGKYSGEIFSHLNNCEFEIFYQIIWAKQHFSFGRGDYHWMHEPCFYAVKKGHKHNWQGSRKETTLWEIESLNPIGKTGKNEDKEEKTGHSTQKPLECMAKPIRNNTAKGESVYDPFLGSGTTLIAADRLERICFGIELSPAYCDVIVKRWVKDRKKRGLDFKVKKNDKIIEDFNGA